jgi:hypothetical protein
VKEQVEAVDHSEEDRRRDTGPKVRAEEAVVAPLPAISARKVLGVGDLRRPSLSALRSARDISLPVS